MIFQRLFTVKYLTSNTCFCTFSQNNLKLLQSNSIIITTSNGSINYFSVEAGFVSLDEQTIGLNSVYAKILNIEENSVVSVSDIPRPSSVKSITICAANKDDHEVLELLAENVQSTLLGQIRVLRNAQNFVIRVGNSIHVVVNVCSITPFSPGYLDNLTEVVIKPPDELNTKHKNLLTGDLKIKHSPKTADVFMKYVDPLRNPLILRVVPYNGLIEHIDELAQPFSVFVFRNALPLTLVEHTLTRPFIYTVKRWLNSQLLDISPVYVRLYVFEDLLENFTLKISCVDNIFVSDALMEHLKIDMGSRISLDFYGGNLPEVDELEIYTKKDFIVNVEEKFRQFLASNCKSQAFILNKDATMDISGNIRCFLRFNPCEAEFAFVNPDFVRTCKLMVFNESVPQKESFDTEEFNPSSFVTTVANYQKIIDKALSLFIFNTKPHTKMYNVLVTGKSGTGKSTLLKMIGKQISDFPHFIHTKKISCKSIKGKTVESLQKFFTSAMFDLIQHQPSVLVLDDLHILCEHVNEGDALAQNALYFNRVSEMLEGLFQTICEENCIGILASATSTSNLNKNIYATRGNHLFKHVFTIHNLSQNDREKVLNHLLSHTSCQDINFSELAKKTESFIIQDLVDLVNKATFESYVKDCTQSDIIIVTSEHCDKALETVTNTVLNGLKLNPYGCKIMDDIGGLTDAKNTLIETMSWPTKYPSLFANAPLRLPSGLLLYGPPGTGKTILAGAAARHCGLRFISIKGPELLSKYIGASEQAVRDVFQRAQSAKPCVLFFDEFDSLAPRRGHDNTGVTDRVVNQLLTQLDGVESLSGVFVLAATSRPDLLDPALLRPGRLDRHIRCSLPDKLARLDILKAVSKSMKFTSDVNLLEIANKSESFSGADLAAMLYTAQLESVKDLLVENEASSQQAEKFINQDQLLEALKSTRPSLSKTDQLKYQKIYQQFEGVTKTEFAPGSKATLA